VELGTAIARLYPGKMTWEANQKLAGNKAFLQAMKAGEEPATIVQNYTSQLNAFNARRAKFLLY
jgi:hypothetical protein